MSAGLGWPPAGTPHGSIPRSPRVIRWMPVVCFPHPRPRVVFEHLLVVETPVAMIQGLGWRDRPDAPVHVALLRLGGPNQAPVWITPLEWQLRDPRDRRFEVVGDDGRPMDEAWRAEPLGPYLAESRPDVWALVVAEVRRAVRDFLDRGATGIVLDGQVRVTAER